MALNVLGLERKKGEWEMNGKKGVYDNQMIYCFDDTTADGLEGNRVKIIKIKSENLTCNLSVGDKIHVFYNEYRKPDFVQIL